jgi:hypothetical protein
MKYNKGDKVYTRIATYGFYIGDFRYDILEEVEIVGVYPTTERYRIERKRTNERTMTREVYLYATKKEILEEELKIINETLEIYQKMKSEREEMLEEIT